MATQIKNTDTPKTDDAFYKIARNEWVVDADFARQLERENNELKHQLKEAKECAERMADRLTKTDAALREIAGIPFLASQGREQPARGNHDIRERIKNE